METGWWIALGGVILLALVATLVDGIGRLGDRRRAPRHDDDSDTGEESEPGEG